MSQIRQARQHGRLEMLDQVARAFLRVRELLSQGHATSRLLDHHNAPKPMRDRQKVQAGTISQGRESNFPGMGDEFELRTRNRANRTEVSDLARKADQSSPRRRNGRLVPG